jgi:c-di-GMP-binding flagellar brake protein YcgR
MKERRLATRIKTSLDADYLKLAHPSSLGTVGKGTIIDLSLGGCCLFVSKKDTLDIGNRIKLFFILDDRNRTNIVREATVRYVIGNHVGCKFAPQIHGSEPEFVSYINSHLSQDTGEKI